MTNTRLSLITALLAALASCSDPTQVAPPVLLAPGGGGGEPTVTRTSPTGAGVDATLDIRVIGTNFDRGSRADLALGGVVGPKVKTNSTRYVSSAELVINVTIAADADTGAYDVVVTVSTGKKGIGTEMFAVQSVLDLNQGQTGFVDYWARHISDAGWVFVSPNLVWLDPTVPLAGTALPIGIREIGDIGNGRGDVTAHPPQSVSPTAVLLSDGAGGWTLSDDLTLPPGWSEPTSFRGMNDSRILVGGATNPARSNTSPLLWLPDPTDPTAYTAWPLALPATVAGCTLTSVLAKAVNDHANPIEVVGVATQSPQGRTACTPQRAIMWQVTLGPSGPTSSVTDLPLPASIPGYKDLPSSVKYETNDINDAGVITGYLVSTSRSSPPPRPIRWWPCGVGPSGCTGPGWRVEVGSYGLLSSDIDACGRATLFYNGGGSIWEVDGLRTPLGLPPELAGVAYVRGVLDITERYAAGVAQGPDIGTHALVWQLPSCTPLTHR